jgi:hypothetical protein
MKSGFPERFPRLLPFPLSRIRLCIRWSLVSLDSRCSQLKDFESRVQGPILLLSAGVDAFDALPKAAIWASLATFFTFISSLDARFARTLLDFAQVFLFAQ